ncbi:MAG: hypothetical protein A2342_10200 [Gallionellales bacterium RIFOXYB12_FULL_54_9]|nr:MAG: hypothetical protein A2342_10200 [Gallionellales bacterium RIFOXYB12_FULL_54_9]
MAGDMEILFSLAGRVHTLLRRESSRIIDVEWLCADAAYAREVIRLVATIESEELQKLAERIREVHPLFLKTAERAGSVIVPSECKYTNTLR